MGLAHDHDIVCPALGLGRAGAPAHLGVAQHRAVMNHHRDVGQEVPVVVIGVRIRRWVTMHGIAINLDPTLEHFSGIVPCGITGEALGVTSLHQLGILISMPELDSALRSSFEEVFARG